MAGLGTRDSGLGKAGGAIRIRDFVLLALPACAPAAICRVPGPESRGPECGT